jgi:protein-S-isoprenylcysteine O-methyltransferase Ste14
MKSFFRIIIWFVFIFGGIGLSVYLDRHVLHLKELQRGVIYYIVLGIGSMLFANAFFSTGNVGRALAKYGRKAKDLPRMQTDQLVTTGIYAMMRHPMNQTLMIFPMAIAIMIVSPSFIFIIAPLEILAMYIMILLIEEPETRKKFGKAYDDYCAKTPRFCFKWKCLKALTRNPDHDWLNKESNQS